jgi:multidrug transporter EmrE-like cation transporter
MKTTLLMIAMIACTIGANLLMKVGADVPTERRILGGLISMPAIAGMALFGVAMLFYLAVLHRLPLNLAQGFAAAQFVGVILAARLVLGESILPLQWIFMVLITIGVIGIGFTMGHASS